MATELRQQLCRSLVGTIEQVSQRLGSEACYGLVLYCPSGCTEFGVAYNTIESLDRRNRRGAVDPEQRFINEVSAPEWAFVTGHAHDFAAANRTIDRFYLELYDGSFEDVGIAEDASTAELTRIASEFLVDACVHAIEDAKSSGCLSASSFVPDVLLGLQFCDPSAESSWMIRAVSAAVNSAAWHEKVVRLVRRIEERSLRPGE